MFKPWSRLSRIALAPDGGAATGTGAGDMGGGGGNGGGAPAVDAGGTPSWDAALAPDLRQLVTTKGWKSPVDALTSYQQLETTLGRDKVALPGKDAKPEDWAAVWNKLGRPESPDKYDLSAFKAPEGMPWNADGQKVMVGKMHELGLNQQQVQGMLTAYAGLQGEAWQGAQAGAAKAAETAQVELRKEWGADFDRQMDLANRAVREAFGGDLEAAKQIKLADGTFLLDNPALARAMAKMGATISEDGDLAGSRGNSGPGVVRNPAQAKAEIERIRAEAATDPKHPYINRQHPEYKAMQTRMNELYALAHQGQARSTD